MKTEKQNNQPAHRLDISKQINSEEYSFADYVTGKTARAKSNVVLLMGNFTGETGTELTDETIYYALQGVLIELQSIECQVIESCKAVDGID